MTHVQRDSPPDVRFWQPRAIFLVGFLASMIFWWFGLAVIDYQGQYPLMSFTTAGLFVFGFPMTLGMSVAYACLVALLARKSWIWCAIAFGVVLALTGVNIYQGLPSTRVTDLIGAEAATLAKIERLQVHDTMGDGNFTSGILSGPNDLVQRIADYRTMDKNLGPLHQFQQSFRDHKFPDYGYLWSDDRMMLYRDDASGKLYFLEDGLNADMEQ